MKIRSQDSSSFGGTLVPPWQGVFYSLILFLTTFLIIYLILETDKFLQARSFYSPHLMTAILGAALMMIAGQTAARLLTRFIERYIVHPGTEKLREENIKFRDLAVEQDRLKAVSTLAAGMAHEIKNPLTSIRTFAEYLPEQYDNPQFRERFSRIVVDEVDRVNHIVNQLLEFARPEPPDMKPHAVDGLLNETLSLLSHNLIQNHIQVEKQYGAGLNLLGDKNQLKQVFLNIFLNSIQAMPKGGKLSIRTNILRQTASKQTLSIRIADNGCGIPKEHLKYVFDPFFTTKDQGTGLGLSIVHAIVAKHGGQIEIESEADKGTCLNVTLTCPS